MRELIERGLRACREEDTVTVADVFLELTAALDFAYDGAARRLSTLYRGNVQAARRGKFAPARATLRLLREHGTLRR